MTADATTILGAENFSAELVAALVASTQAAASASATWFGRGDKNAADQAAVTAMREALVNAPFDGRVVIGEGEKDQAPMLANGERLGNGRGPTCDIAVDPLDGTTLVARGRPGSICVISLAPRGTLFDPGDSFYLEKLVAPVPGLDLRASVAENLNVLAASLDKPVADLVVAVLDKPRHHGVRTQIAATGARIHLLGEGDVSAAVAAATPRSGIDLLLGIGGSPEGVIAACAVRALGGFMQAHLAEQSGAVHGSVLSLDDLVASDQVLYVATPVQAAGMPAQWAPQ